MNFKQKKNEAKHLDTICSRLLTRPASTLYHTTFFLDMSLNEQRKKCALLMTSLKVAANHSLAFLLPQFGCGDHGVRWLCLEVGLKLKAFPVSATGQWRTRCHVQFTLCPTPFFNSPRTTKSRYNEAISHPRRLR